MDFSKFDKMVDLDGLKKDVEAAAENGKTEYAEVPCGVYEVAIEKLELKETKSTGKPMLSCWMRVVSEGLCKGQFIFMNQVISQGFQIHIAKEFLKSLMKGDNALAVQFESYSQFAELLMDIGEYISGRYEYGLKYGENAKGFKTYEITDIFELEG